MSINLVKARAFGGWVLDTASKLIAFDGWGVVILPSFPTSTTTSIASLGITTTTSVASSGVSSASSLATTGITCITEIG